MSYEELAGFLANCSSETLVTVVIDGKHYRREQGELPMPEFEDMSSGFVFVQYRGRNAPCKKMCAADCEISTSTDQ